MAKRKQRSMPAIGSSFSRVYKDNTYKMVVINTPEGIRFKTRGGIFSTPTAAAKAITQSEVNGWSFWGID